MRSGYFLQFLLVLVAITARVHTIIKDLCPHLQMTHEASLSLLSLLYVSREHLR
jgi:hypothetical protein